MESLILAFERQRPTLEDIAAALSSFSSLEVQDDQVVVCERGDCVFVQPEDQPPAWWFQSWPSDLVPADPQALVLAYRDGDLVKRVVLTLAQRYRFVVDTDTGGIYASDDFARRCGREPGWDWRHGARTVLAPASRQRRRA